MLAQFTMKNVLSFKDEMTLDLSAISAYKQHKYNLIHGKQEDYVRFAAVYGANASGKTNLFFGLMMFKDIVLHSMNSVGNIDENVLKRNYWPFAFEESSIPSEFQIVFCDEEFEYRYGFEFTDKKIVSEWLYKKDFKTKRQTVLIERTEKEISIGASVRRECDKYKAQISNETLALTFFSNLSFKTDIFKKVTSEISSMLIMDSTSYESTETMEKFLPFLIDKRKGELIGFLTAIDTGIKDILYETIESKIEFFTFHMGKDGKLHKLNLYRESSGTLKSIIIFIFATSVILSNGVLIVDELNTRLHPLLLKFIIDLFKNEDSKAQLIYTTHDTTLLDKKFFRRDQVWFVEKDEYGYSKLTALSDFKIRSDASFEKDYLSGVYGGIPTLLEYVQEVGK